MMGDRLFIQPRAHHPRAHNCPIGLRRICGTCTHFQGPGPTAIGVCGNFDAGVRGLRDAGGCGDWERRTAPHSPQAKRRIAPPRASKPVARSSSPPTLADRQRSVARRSTAPGAGGRPRTANVDAMIRLRREGLTYPEIADRVGCSKSTVARLLTEAGETARRNTMSRRIRPEDVQRGLDDGLNDEGIAARLGCHVTTVAKVRREDLGQTKRQGVKVSLDPDRLRTLWADASMTKGAIAAAVGVSVQTVVRCAAELDLPARPHVPRFGVSTQRKVDPGRLRELMASGASDAEMAAEFGCAIGTIRSARTRVRKGWS